MTDPIKLLKKNYFFVNAVLRTHHLGGEVLCFLFLYSIGIVTS